MSSSAPWSCGSKRRRDDRGVVRRRPEDRPRRAPGGELSGPGERAGVLARHELEPAEFLLATFHRPENVDDPDVLATILSELALSPLPVMMPLHPRTRAKVGGFGLEGLLKPLRITEPIGYREFLALAAESAPL